MEPRIVFLQPKIGMAAAALSGLVVTDPCADITAALGPTLSPVSCEPASSRATNGEGISPRAGIKGSAAKAAETTVPDSTDHPICSTSTEKQHLNGGSSSILLEHTAVAADDYEKGATSLQEDLQVTSPSNDTGLGNMDSLLSMQSSSDISNGLSHSPNDSSLPPSFSRLPPDGHEFPPNYQEPLRAANNSMTSDLSITKSTESPSITDSPPDMPPPPLPASCPPQKAPAEATIPAVKSLPPPPPARKPPPKDVSGFTSRFPPRPITERRHWMKDEKSEKSVRDKIAMFQSETSGDTPPPVPPAPPIPAARSPFKYDGLENSQRSRKSLLTWEEDNRGRNHLSRSMMNMEGTGRTNDYSSPTIQPSATLYKSSVHNSTGDVSTGIESGDTSRTLEFVRTRSNLDLTSSSASCSPDSSLSSASSYSSGGVYSTLPRKPIATQRNPAPPERMTSTLNNRSASPESSWKSPTFAPGNKPGNLHSRSQSLVDVASPKRHSFGGSYNYKYGSKGYDDARKSSLNAMIEQRRRNVSKLRGLIIPEKAEVPRCDQSLFDLPEIKSRDAIIINANCKTSTLPRSETKSHNRWSESMNGHNVKTQSAINTFVNNNTNNGVTLSSPPWKSQVPLPDLPKYSPAFKRRSLSVHGLSTTSLDANRDDLHSQDQSKIYPPSKPPRTSNCYGIGPTSPLGPEPKSLESITSPRSDSSFDFSSICHNDSAKEEEVVPVIKSNGSASSYVEGHNGKPNHRGLLHVPPRGASGEDSDNDSAVSSSRSSISHGFSPPSSPLPGDTSDGGMRPSGPRQHRDRLHSEDRSRVSTSQRRSVGSIVERSSSPEKRPLRRTLSSETTASVSSAASTASTVTSGSQDGGNGGSGSDSSSNRRVLKAQSVEAINRKNVLASAKYSSGRDLKVGSPLIKRKFEEDGSGTEADVEDAAKMENHTNSPLLHPNSPLLHPNGTERLSTHYKTTREVNGIHETEAARNMEIKVAYVDEIIEYPFVNGRVECSEVPVPAQRSIYTSVSSPRPTSPISEYSTTESVCGSHKEDKKGDSKGLEDRETNSEEVATKPTSSPSVPIDRWMELEKKYAPKISPSEARSSLDAQESPYKGHILEDEIDYHNRNVGSDGEKNRARTYSDKQKDSGNGFRAIAEKWQIISNDASTLPSPTNPVAAVAASSTVSTQSRKHSRRSSTNGADTNRSPMTSELARSKGEETLRIPPPPETAPPPIPQTNIESPISESVRLREKKASPLARPISFNGCGEKTRIVTTRESLVSQETRLSNRQDTTAEIRGVSAIPTTTATSVPLTLRPNNRRSVSVNDIRKAFEKVELTVSPNGRGSTVTRTKPSTMTAVHTRVSSLDSTTSEDSTMPTPAHYGSVNNLASNHRDQFGSITSLASSTSLISQQELQQLIDEANQSLEEASSVGGGAPVVHELEVVVLHREMAGSSVGITLAGGADYEAKEITVHKVLAGSPAERDGRLQRGDRILSINGKSMKGATHREAISILKAPRSEVVLVVSRSKHENSSLHQSQQGANGGTEVSLSNLSTTTIRGLGSCSRPPRIAEQPAEGAGESCEEAEKKKEDESRGPPETISLTKDGAGLGFSLEGGKDSPSGDKPLTIKKIFTGGAAEKHGGLHVGDELLVVNGIDVTPLSRIEAWGIMKKLPDGMVSLTIRRKL